MSDLLKIDLDVEFYTGLLKGKCIGFGGKLGSGKTFIANALSEFINNNSSVPAIRRSFADELRSCIETKVGIPVRQYKHRFEPIAEIDRIFCRNKMIVFINEHGFNMNLAFLTERYAACNDYNDLYRVTLQLVGTELYRMQVDMDYWANSVGNNLDPDVITIIDDIRFPNEINVVKNNGISVYSMLLKKLESALDLHVTNHASETSVGGEDFDIIFFNMIDNNRTNEMFGKQIFNTVVPHYYLFKVLSGEPEKEKYLQNTIKTACNF